MSVILCYAVLQIAIARGDNMSTLTLRIDEEMERQLEQIAQARHSTKSQIVREMLKKHLALARFQALRAQAIPYAEAAGYLTDEDVFRDIS